jgi:dTDP-4-amino-4,6-dideoxygalactose transaminase
VPNITLFHTGSDTATENAALSILRSGQIASGPKVAAFEQALTPWVGLPHVVVTSDLSSAMLLALHQCGVRSGDEVLSPAYTCMSSAAPIANLGARPRWVDVDAETGLLDPQALRRCIGARTRACVVYHAAGYAAHSTEIARVCRQHGIPLIEDCNTALGARLHGQPLGSHGDAAIYSFYPNRQVNGIEGGAVAWRDAHNATRSRKLRRFGIDGCGFRDAIGEIDPASDIPEVGWSGSMNQLNCAVGLEQLHGLAARLQATRSNAARLHQLLAGLPGLSIVRPHDGSEPAYWGFLVFATQRDAVLARLKHDGVMASKLHHRIDRYSGFGVDAVDLPGTEAFLDRMIALPCGHWLDDAALQRIARSLEGALRRS